MTPAIPSLPGSYSGRGITLLASLLMVLTWGSSAVFVKIGMESYAPGQLTLLRFLITSAALGAIAVAGRMRVPGWRDLGRIALLAFVGITFTQLTFTYGIKSVDPGTATFLLATLPVMAAIMARFLLGERLTGIGWTGILVAVMGTALLVYGQHEAVGFTRGALILLAGAFSEALYYIFQKPLLRRYSGFELSTWALIISTIPLLIFLPGLGSQVAAASARSTASVAVIAIGAGVIGYVCMSIVNTHWPASVAAILMAALPPVALATAWLLLGEVPPILSIAGGAISLAGVLMVTRYGKAAPVVSPETPLAAPATA